MSFKLRRLVVVLAVASAWLTTLTQSALAGEHAVRAADLHQALVDSAKTRQTNIETVQKFFSSQVVKKHLRGRMANLSKVEKGVPSLSDQELSQLASQCRQVESDISAGSLSNQQITYILIALATAVIILVIVVA